MVDPTVYDERAQAIYALRAEVHRLRTLMAEAAKQNPETCRKWIRDALAANAAFDDKGNK